jgi:hypothetical protein
MRDPKRIPRVVALFGSIPGVDTVFDARKPLAFDSTACCMRARLVLCATSLLKLSKELREKSAMTVDLPVPKRGFSDIAREWIRLYTLAGLASNIHFFFEKMKF